MSKYSFLIVAAFLLVTRLAHSADDRYPVSGAGAISCGQWIETRSSGSKNLDNLLTTWLQGFLSGMNTQRQLMTDQKMSLVPDPPTLLAYVDKQCRDNPLDSVYAISIRLYLDIQKK